MNFQPIEDAIRSWVKTATGFADAQVYFGNQNGAQNAVAPFITITIGIGAGHRGAFDEMERFVDLTRPNGQEIQQRVTSQLELLVSIQAFAENVTSYPVPTFPLNPPVGSGRTAVDLLLDVQTALSLESVRDALNAANLAPFDVGDVKRLDAVVATGFEGRAALDCRMYTTNQQSDFAGYIAEITGTGTLSGTGDDTDPRVVPFQAGP